MKGEALKKVMAKLAAGGEEVGKTAIGAASVGAKKAAKVAKANPKTASAIGGAVAGAGAVKAMDDDKDDSALGRFLKKKKLDRDEEC